MVSEYEQNFLLQPPNSPVNTHMQIQGFTTTLTGLMSAIVYHKPSCFIPVFSVLASEVDSYRKLLLLKSGDVFCHKVIHLLCLLQWKQKQDKHLSATGGHKSAQHGSTHVSIYFAP